MLDEGNLEDKSVPHRKSAQLWTMSDDTVQYGRHRQ
jgi:hypothetical protein